MTISERDQQVAVDDREPRNARPGPNVPEADITAMITGIQMRRGTSTTAATSPMARGDEARLVLSSADEKRPRRVRHGRDPLGRVPSSSGPAVVEVECSE